MKLLLKFSILAILISVFSGCVPAEEEPATVQETVDKTTVQDATDTTEDEGQTTIESDAAIVVTPGEETEITTEAERLGPEEGNSVIESDASIQSFPAE